VSHIAAALFFSLLFIAAGIAGQLMVREYWEEILAALRGHAPVRKPAPAPLMTVTIRPQLRFAHARRRAAF
jgi:hypothetical protein